MEAAKDGIFISSGVTVKGDEAPESYRVAPITENSILNPNPNSNLNPTSNPNTYNSNPNPNPNPNPSPHPNTIQFGGPAVTASPVSGDTKVKKKRGRPRKYAPDGALASALSPMPISSSIPLTADFSSSSSWKRGRGRPLESSVKKQHKYEHKFEYESTGERLAYFVGANFTPHVITVNTGEGRFEILSLSGSYMPTDSGGTKSRSGGMSISLAGPDGRVVGGGLAGMLVAAGPVQVVIGSFLPGHQQEQKHKKQRTELPPAVAPVNIVSAEEMKGAYVGVKPVLISSSSLHGDNSASLNPMMHAFRNSVSDNKTSSPEDGSKGLDLSNCEVSS